MYIDTFIEAWNDLADCQYSDPVSGAFGTVAHIDYYGMDGYCARVVYPNVGDVWYRWSTGGYVRRCEAPKERGTGITPPGCWL